MIRLFTSPSSAPPRIQPRCTGPSTVGQTSAGTTSSTPSVQKMRGGRTCPRHALRHPSTRNMPPTVNPNRRSCADDAPAIGRGLEQRVDERGDRRALAEHDQRAEEREHEHDRPEPPLLAHAHEGPELTQKRHDGRTRHGSYLARAYPRARVRVKRV